MILALLTAIIPDFGKHSFVIWASYGTTLLISGALIAHNIIRRKDR